MWERAVVNLGRISARLPASLKVGINAVRFVSNVHSLHE